MQPASMALVCHGIDKGQIASRELIDVKPQQAREFSEVMMKSFADALPPKSPVKSTPTGGRMRPPIGRLATISLANIMGSGLGLPMGIVIASGSSPVAVFHDAEATGRNPFVTRVGRESEPVRMRRV